jgi:hypothetical protein
MIDTLSLWNRVGQSLRNSSSTGVLTSAGAKVIVRGGLAGTTVRSDAGRFFLGLTYEGDDANEYQDTYSS